ncbi:MAG: hypothetical protein LW714_11510 [Oxalobacteraceae bacterium]|jgi:hypothetical protein|nr:hypothetical protein [Oxalobacteraceae bacterium]
MTEQAKPLLDCDELAEELAAIAAESIGWQPLARGAYLHVGSRDDNVITIVGVADVSMDGMNVLLLT